MTFRKILFVFGTRPEAIKMAPLIKTLSKCESIGSRICITGQHRQMLDQVLELFEIKPDYDLNLMKPNQDLYDITNNVLLGLRSVLRDYMPESIIVHGDTTTTFAASLAAFYEKVSVFHLEAGLRTNNKYSPWPEEMNRQLTGRIADFHFAPTLASKENLLKEGISDDKILVTGNTVIDALLMVKEKINSGRFDGDIKNVIPKIDKSRRLMLVTCHRRENFGEPLKQICEALIQIVEMNDDLEIVIPVHLNPNVKRIIFDRLGDTCKHSSRIHLIDPLDYLPFVYLMVQSDIIVSDSGGVQEEAPSLGKPVLVLRDTTERPEAVKAGTVNLVGSDTAKIVKSVCDLLANGEAYEAMAKAINPYGDGKACERIQSYLQSGTASEMMSFGYC